MHVEFGIEGWWEDSGGAGCPCRSTLLIGSLVLHGDVLDEVAQLLLLHDHLKPVDPEVPILPHVTNYELLGSLDLTRIQ